MLSKFRARLHWALMLGMAFAGTPAWAAKADHQTFTYVGSFAGVKVLDLRAGVSLRDDGYQLGIDFHTTGAVDLLMHSQGHTMVDGLWHNGRASPIRYMSDAVFRGRPRQVEINYPDGQPHIAIQIPLTDPDREPVPPIMQRDTMDGLSAIADLLEHVANTGACDGDVRTFDGRLVSEVQVRSFGPELVAEESGRAFHGLALRCDITTTPLAGFAKDSEPGDAQRSPRHSSVWFARLHGDGPLVAVLMEVELRIAGHMTLTLTDVGL